jgi:hypothetical protein
MDAIRDNTDKPVQPGLMEALGEVAIREATARLEKKFARYCRIFEEYAQANKPEETAALRRVVEGAAAHCDTVSYGACKAVFALAELLDPEGYAEIGKRYRVNEWPVALVDPTVAERRTMRFPDALLDAYLNDGNIASPSRAYGGLNDLNLDGRNDEYIVAAAMVDAEAWDVPDWPNRVIAAKKIRRAKTGRQHLREAGFASVEELFARAGLTTKLIDALMLKYDGRKSKGAACDLGIREDTYRQRVHRAETALRQVLEPAADT